VDRRIAIIGAGGFGREVFSILDSIGYEIAGFVDVDSSRDHLPGPLIGDDSYLPELMGGEIADCVCVALGNVEKRKELFELAKQYDLGLPAIVHPSAAVLTGIPIPEGAIIYPNAVLMADCRIGRGVLVNSGATLGHDVMVGDFSNISPGVNVAGHVTIGQQAFLGIGCCVREKTQIGDRALVGAGSVVLDDVLPDRIVYGVPARERTLL
jgi:sugar O-acyltransferase (sialic acid O-acetyltransferase NeuD family)